MRNIIIILMVVCLSGCQEIQQQQAQQKRIEASNKRMLAVAACREGILTRKNAVERADCIAEARRQEQRDINSPVMWVLEQDLVADRETAMAYSEGKITKEQYTMEVKKHFAEALQVEAQALSAMRQQNMQQQQQNNQALLGALSMMPQPQPAAQPYMMPTRKPIQTNCNGYGNSVNCTTY